MMKRSMPDILQGQQGPFQLPAISFPVRSFPVWIKHALYLQKGPIASYVLYIPEPELYQFCPMLTAQSYHQTPGG